MYDNINSKTKYEKLECNLRSRIYNRNFQLFPKGCLFCESKLQVRITITILRTILA